MNNKQIIQSTESITLGYDINVLESKMLTLITDKIQVLLKGTHVIGQAKSLEIGEDLHVEINLRDIFPRGMDIRYSDIIEAVKSIGAKTFSYFDIEEDRRKWKFYSFLVSSTIIFDDETASFDISKDYINAVCNFTHGFRKYELDNVLKLPTDVSIRFYKLMSYQCKPFSMDIRRVVFMLGNKKCYRNTNVLTITLKRISETLRKHDIPYNFEFSINQQFGRVKFYPIIGKSALESKLQKDDNTARRIYGMLSKEVVDKIMAEGFTRQIFIRRKLLFEKFACHTNYKEALDNIIKSSRNAKTKKRIIMKKIEQWVYEKEKGNDITWDE